MARNDASMLVRLPSELRDRVKEAAGQESASDWVRGAIEARLNGVVSVPKLVPKSSMVPGVVSAGPGRVMVGGPDPRFATVASAIRKRGRSTVRQIVLDTGMTDMAVESVLRKMQVRWPEPGVVELSE